MTNSDAINPFKDDMTGKILLGRYRVVRRLAAGGMGVVYLARAEGAAGFVKPVVVKLILPVLASSEEFSGMFAREARILANLQHPGIVSIIEFAEELDCNIMVLEYVHGFQLGQWRKYLNSLNREVPTPVAIQIVINVLDALHYAHTLKTHSGEKRQIIHRDISPGNIMIDVDGHVKLVDFGIAFATENTEGYKTTNKSFKGKLSYSAPELFANKKATVQSDIYSCGITLHETLVGRNEFNFKDHASIVNAVLNHVPSSIHACRDDAPERIDEVIWKALAKKPELRYKSAAEFASDLREISTIAEHKAQAALAELVARDFDEEMSDFLKVESLASRERAWRTPSVIPTTIPAKSVLHDTRPFNTMGGRGDASSSNPIRSDSVAVSLEKMVQQQVERQAAASGSQELSMNRTLTETELGVHSIKPLLYVIVALLVVAIFGGVGVLLYNTSKSTTEGSDRFLVVQSSLPADVSGTDMTEKQAGVMSAPETVAPRPSDATESETDTGGGAVSNPKQKQIAKKKEHGNGVRKAKSDRPNLAELTGAFRKQKGKIHRCFEKHPASVEQSSNVSVLFSVLPSGKVEQVQLSPKSLSNTPLGGCLLGVSKATSFPPQSEPISFRIPLSAKRVKP
jgi:eukaryotic-like serine/threonine-protein kinase